MRRPAPTKNIILQLCGADSYLLSCFHHGLYETQLQEVYPYLDLDELAAFAASSWKGREREGDSFAARTASMSPYELFSDVYRIGFPWLNKHKAIINAPRYESLNPFDGKNLKVRLNQVPEDAIAKLRQSLEETVNSYVFDCQYQEAKAWRGGNNHKLVVMHFQSAYPNARTNGPNFAAEVSRIISRYPQEYELLPTPTVLASQ